MQVLRAALSRALIEKTIEAWDHVDRLAFQAVGDGVLTPGKFKDLASLALERSGFDSNGSCIDPDQWVDVLLHKTLQTLERCAALQSQFACIAGVMHSIDQDGRIIAVTDAWLQMLGYESRNRVLGQYSTAFLTEESKERAKTVLPQFWREGFVRDCAYTMVRHDGQIVPVFFDAICARDDEGTPTNSICVVRKRNNIPLFDIK